MRKEKKMGKPNDGQKYYRYSRHGVNYYAPMTSGMTRNMMKKIYSLGKGQLGEKDIIYVQFPETTYTKMTKEEWSNKISLKREV